MDLIDFLGEAKRSAAPEETLANHPVSRYRDFRKIVRVLSQIHGKGKDLSGAAVKPAAR